MGPLRLVGSYENVELSSSFPFDLYTLLPLPVLSLLILIEVIHGAPLHEAKPQSARSTSYLS